MTSVKAKLSVILKANDVVVAEAEDSGLWQKVLVLIEGGQVDLGTGNGSAVDQAQAREAAGRKGAAIDSTDPIVKLAREIGIEPEAFVGACAPTLQAPFLILDDHCWQALRRHVPLRGKKAISPIAVSATLLTLWFRAAGQGNPTQAQAQAILRSVNTEDKNPSRGIRRAKWLQARPGGQIHLNIAAISDALEVAKCFCTKKWDTWTKPKE